VQKSVRKIYFSKRHLTLQALSSYDTPHNKNNNILLSRFLKPQQVVPAQVWQQCQ